MIRSCRTFSKSFGPLTRTDFVRFAGAGGDFNPNHHDELHARSQGYPSVFGMGLFTASLVSGCITREFGHALLRSFRVRFVAPVWPGDVLYVSGNVIRSTDRCDTVEISVHGGDGTLRLSGEAEIGEPSTYDQVTRSESSRLPIDHRSSIDGTCLTQRVGSVLRTVNLPVERGKVREFAVAMHDDIPIYRNVDAAKAAGFSNIPAPPVFTSTASFHVDPNVASFPIVLGLNRSRVVHGEHCWRYHRLPIVGETLTGVSRLSDVFLKKNSAGRVLRFIKVTTEYMDEMGNEVIEESMLAIEKLNVEGGPEAEAG